MLLRTPDPAPRTSPLVIDAAGQTGSQATQFMHLGGLVGASRRKRRHHARKQTTGPTRKGMVQSIQAGAVRYGGCPVHSESAHAKGRGGGDPAVRVCNVDPRQEALR